ncbi:MAG: hypothetical protein HKL86_05985 [Acidimicrobiaceae bacterium]|nr:hypothetical protein [Acidimicrobiaceae bacterium]
MELTRLAITLDRLGEVAKLAEERPLVVTCAPHDTVVAMGSLEGQLEVPIGIWLEVSMDYRAQIAARDVATLSWLIELDHVVIASDELAEQHAQVVRAMLSDGEVTFSNAVANVTGAYNRPAPPNAIRVWSYDGTSLTTPGLDPLVASSDEVGIGQTRFE